MQLTKAVNNIAENSMPNSNKPIKFAHLQKIANQSMLHGAHVKEMAKTFTVVFMKARKSLVVRWREKSVNWKKYHSMVEMYVLKLILKFIMKISVSVTRINGGKIVPHCVRFLHIHFWSGRKIYKGCIYMAKATWCEITNQKKSIFYLTKEHVFCVNI